MLPAQLQVRRRSLGLGPSQGRVVRRLALLRQLPGDAALDGLLVGGAVVQQPEASPAAGRLLLADEAARRRYSSEGAEAPPTTSDGAEAPPTTSGASVVAHRTRKLLPARA